MALFLPRIGMPAQASSASLRGTVQSPTGEPLPEAVIIVKNPETEQSHTAGSNAAGQFEFLQLDPGIYEVQASRPGYVTQTRKGLELVAGRPQILQLVLAQATENPKGATEDTGSAPVAPVSATTANQIDQSQLVGLPLNGRSYSQLATLHAGVADPAAGSASRGGSGGSLTVAGGRTTSNNFHLDGTNIMNTQNRVPRSAAGVQLGSDAVLQVQVFSANYGAEYGRGSGGILNAITHSGTNEFHGTLFEFFRNSNLDARNFFDPGPEPPPFKRNQFGFTFTGPVRRDRTFFMGSFEGLRDRLTETSTDFFPDEQAREGMITDIDGTVTQTVTVNPNVIPYLALYPLPNGDPTGRGIGENRAPQFMPTDEIFFTVRLDHKLTEKDSFFARYTFDDATSFSGQPSYLFRTLSESRQQYLTLLGTHIFNPSVLNSFRLGFTRPVTHQQTISLFDIPRSLFFVPDSPQFGQLNVPGLTPFGPIPGTPLGRVMTTFQFAYDTLAQKGNHTFKFGMEAHRYRWDVFTNFKKGAVWSFNSMESFLEGGSDGTTILDVTLPGSDNSKAYRQTLMGFYIQDDYKLSTRLQLNLGLRYEFTTLLHDKSGRTAALLDTVRGDAVQVGPLLGNNPSLLNIAPRIGFRWSPWSGGNTALSGGFGVYYDQLLEYIFDQQKNTVPFFREAVRTNFCSAQVCDSPSAGPPTPFPDALAAAEQVPLLARTLDYFHTASPMVLRYNVTIQQQLSADWQFRASFVGARGNHLVRSYEVNLAPVPITRSDGSLFFPPYSPDGPNNRVNPAFGSIGLIGTDAQSFYNSLQLSATKRVGRGLSLQARYTYSKSVDDISVKPFTDRHAAKQYGMLRTLERGLSDFDIRHRMVANYFYALPLGAGKRWWNSGLLAQIFGGWRLGGIVSFRSGVPFSPQVNVRTSGFLFSAARPNLLPGRSNNPVEGVTAGCSGVAAGQKLGGPDLYFDPCVYAVPPPGTLGNAGRNTIIGSNIFNMDVSFQKEFTVDAKKRLQFRAEFFNLPNHTTFDRRIGGTPFVFTGTSGRLNPNAAKIRGTATTARQIQFALRFSF